jgi:DNA-binding transcriptional regulator GbsR (MarR family)
MNKVDYLLQTYKRVHQSTVGHVQFSILVALGKANRALCAAEIKEITGVSHPSMPLRTMKKYVIQHEAVKVDDRWKHMYELSPEGLEFIKETLS